MTAEELYRITKSIMFEKSTSKDYDNYYIDNINMVLVECFDLNNRYREWLGKKPLNSIPIITQKNDVIEYEDKICREVLPNGLACRFFIDDDLAKFNIFNVYYENAKANNSKCLNASIGDVYG